MRRLALIALLLWFSTPAVALVSVGGRSVIIQENSITLGATNILNFDSDFDVSFSGGIPTISPGTNFTMVGTIDEADLPATTLFTDQARTLAEVLTVGTGGAIKVQTATGFEIGDNSSTEMKLLFNANSTDPYFSYVSAIASSITATGGFAVRAPGVQATFSLVNSGNSTVVSFLANTVSNDATLRLGVANKVLRFQNSSSADLWLMDSSDGSFTLSGQSARTVRAVRHTTSNTAGNNLTVKASGATSAATDKSGGALILSPGEQTGKPSTSGTRVVIQGTTTATATGTGDSTYVDRVIVPAPKIVADASTTGLFEISLATLKMCGGVVEWSVRATDGTDMQARTGTTSFAVVNKGGTYSLSIACDSQAKVDSATDATCTAGTGSSVALSSGTLAVAPHVASGTNKVTFQINADSSLTPSTGYPEVTYTVTVNCAEAITVL